MNKLPKLQKNQYEVLFNLCTKKFLSGIILLCCIIEAVNFQMPPYGREGKNERTVSCIYAEETGYGNIDDFSGDRHHFLRNACHSGQPVQL